VLDKVSVDEESTLIAELVKGSQQHSGAIRRTHSNTSSNGSYMIQSVLFECQKRCRKCWQKEGHVKGACLYILHSFATIISTGTRS